MDCLISLIMWNALSFFIFCTLMRDGVWLGRRKIRCVSYSPSRLCVLVLGDFSRPPSIANVYHAGYSCVRVLWRQIYHWNNLAGCSSRHLRAERGTTAIYQVDSHMTRVLDIVGTVTCGDKWNIKVGSEREKFTYRPVTRLKQRNNENKLNICLSLLLFMIMLTLLCV